MIFEFRVLYKRGVAALLNVLFTKQHELQSLASLKWSRMGDSMSSGRSAKSSLFNPSSDWFLDELDKLVNDTNDSHRAPQLPYVMVTKKREKREGSGGASLLLACYIE